MTVTGMPFDDIRSLVHEFPEMDTRSVKEADTSPHSGLLGWMAASSGVSPAISRPLVALFAGTHKVDVPADRDDISNRVARIAAGNAPVNRLCSLNELGLKLFDLALSIPAGDIARETALDERTAAGTFGFGMEAIAGGIDLLCLGECGSRSGIPAAALFASIEGGDISRWSADDTHSPKIRQALETHRTATEPLEVMRRLGGRESWALAGAIAAARMQQIPVVLDGPGPLSAALVLQQLESTAVDHCIVASRPADGPLANMVDVLGLRTVLSLNFDRSEGEAAALAAGVLKDLVAIIVAEN